PGRGVTTPERPVSRPAAADHDRLGVCVAACPLAVSFEEPAAALARLEGAGLAVVKMQASCALQADDPSDPVTRNALASFAEPRVLHQTREAAADGPPLGGDELAGA